MKYRISNVPNTAQALKFKVCSQEGGKETLFSFSKEIFMLWGKPSESKLGEAMIAHIKKNGWTKEQVAVDAKNASPNLNTFIASLNKAKAGK